MTNVELTITVLIYLASLLLGERALALAMPEAQEGAFAIAAILSIGAAGLFYYRRERAKPSISVLLTVGGLLAIAVIVVGMFSQLLWQVMLAPSITLPIAVVGTLLLPFALFPVAKKLLNDDQTDASELHAVHVIGAGIAALVCAVVAFAIPAPVRSSIPLIEHTYPGLRIQLPDWRISQNDISPDFGSIRLDDPGANDRYLAVHWSSGDPVQPDEYIHTITADQLPVVDRMPAFVSGHEGVSYFLRSGDGAKKASATVWNCPNDHRVYWLYSYLNGRRAEIKATHRRVLDSIRCHLPSEGRFGLDREPCLPALHSAAWLRERSQEPVTPLHRPAGPDDSFETPASPAVARSSPATCRMTPSPARSNSSRRSTSWTASRRSIQCTTCSATNEKSGRRLAIPPADRSCRSKSWPGIATFAT